MKVVDSAVFLPEVLQENPADYVLLEALAFLDLCRLPFSIFTVRDSGSHSSHLIPL